MNAEKTGKLILEARQKKGLTQKELADSINVTDKAVCKWEKGHGCPDITLLPALSKALGVDIQSLLKGERWVSLAQGGNLKKLKVYRCADCGNVVTSTKEIELSCCSKCLKPLKLSETALGEEKWYEPLVKEFDGQYSVEFKHPMTKENYISNILCVFQDRVTVVNLFAQQEAQIILPQIGGIKLFAINSKNELLPIKL